MPAAFARARRSSASSSPVVAGCASSSRPCRATRTSPIRKFIKDQTPKSQRKGAYLSVGVRVGARHRYQLTVKPKNKNYFLTREPDGPAFPVKGHLNTIKPLDQLNTLRLRAFGTRVDAYVNGKKIASKRESSPGDVAGRRIIFGLGNSRPSKKPIAGLMDNLRVQVPVP